MNRADQIYLDGFRAALDVARRTALRIEASSMSPLRREMAAEALRSFADEAEAAMRVGENFSPPSGMATTP